MPGKGFGPQFGVSERYTFVEKKKEEKPFDWIMLKQDVRSALKVLGLGVGSAVLGAALAAGVGEKKKHVFPTGDADVTSPFPESPLPPGVAELLGRVRAGAPEPYVSSRHDAGASASEEGQGRVLKRQESSGARKEAGGRERKKVLREASREANAQETGVKDEEYFRAAFEQGDVKKISEDFDALKELSRADDILLEIKNKFPHLFLRLAARIHEANIFGEEWYEALAREAIARDPSGYVELLKKEDVASYLPQDDATILQALEQEPTMMLVEGRPGGQGSLLPEAIETAVRRSGDPTLQRLYEIFTNSDSESDEGYTYDQREKIVVLLPLIREGKISIEDAAGLDRLSYLQKLVEVTERKSEYELISARIERGRIADGFMRQLVDHAEESLFQEITEQLSASGVSQILAAHNADNQKDYFTQKGAYEVYDRLFAILNQKIEQERLRWEGLLKKSHAEDALTLLAAAAETNRLGNVFEGVSPRFQGTLVQDIVDVVARNPGRHAPDLAIVIAGLKDSTLLGLVKNDIEDLYRGAATDQMRGVFSLLARVAQEVAPEPVDSLFAKIAARGSSVSLPA